MGPDQGGQDAAVDRGDRCQHGDEPGTSQGAASGVAQRPEHPARDGQRADRQQDRGQVEPPQHEPRQARQAAASPRDDRGPGPDAEQHGPAGRVAVREGEHPPVEHVGVRRERSGGEPHDAAGDVGDLGTHRHGDARGRAQVERARVGVDRLREPEGERRSGPRRPSRRWAGRSARARCGPTPGRPRAGARRGRRPGPPCAAATAGAGPCPSAHPWATMCSRRTSPMTTVTREPRRMALRALGNRMK